VSIGGIPFALFSWGGSWRAMNRVDFDRAVRAGESCGCGSCLDCRALEYWRESGHPGTPAELPEWDGSPT